MHLPPAPEPRELLPPLLACLPTAFVSPQPPPALLPLLSPLLRQRVSYLSGIRQPTSRSDGWLPLLSWDDETGARLPPVVERMELEPHPVSGEVELDDLRPAKYRRLDEETLHSRLEVEQFELLPIYLWCENDEHGGTGPGWKLTALKSLEDVEDDVEWFETISEANDAARAKVAFVTETIGSNGSNGHLHPHVQQEDEDDDGSYWAAYDRTPGRTPGNNASPAPPALSARPPANGARQAEMDYYDRYGAEVQPAMDSHDPDEEHPEIGESTLRGDTLLNHSRPDSRRMGGGLFPTNNGHQPESRPNGASLYPADDPMEIRQRNLEAPRPLSQSSSHSSLQKLEEKALEMSQQYGDERAHLAIKQHISTDIKSLFRLAKSAGMEREEFEEFVRRELDVLSLLEQDE